MNSRLQAKKSGFCALQDTESCSCCCASVFPSLQLMHITDFFLIQKKKKKKNTTELQTGRKKKFSYVSEAPQSGYQQLIPLKTFMIIAARCKYLFLPAVCRGSSSEMNPTSTEVFSKQDGIIFKWPGCPKIFFPASG